MLHLFMHVLCLPLMKLNMKPCMYRLKVLALKSFEVQKYKDFFFVNRNGFWTLMIMHIHKKEFLRLNFQIWESFDLIFKHGKVLVLSAGRNAKRQCR